MLELRKFNDSTGQIKVELVGEAPTEHGFADDALQRYISEGWAEIENPTTVDGSQVDGKDYGGADHGGRSSTVETGDAIVLHLVGGDVRYTIDEHPGVYPPGDSAAEQPYRVTHEYQCTLEG